jgi:hypothetical protein
MYLNILQLKAINVETSLLWFSTADIFSQDQSYTTYKTGINRQRVSVDSAMPCGLISSNTLPVLSCLMCVVWLILRKYICKRINKLLRNYSGIMNKCFDQALTRDFLANLSRTKSQLPEKVRFAHKNSRLTSDDSTYGLPCMDYQSSLRFFKDNVPRIFPNVKEWTIAIRISWSSIWRIDTEICQCYSKLVKTEQQ